MKNSKGFTLLEILIVLSTTITLLSIGSTIHTNLIKKYQTDQFFQLFQSDVMYMQQMTISKRETFYMTIYPNEHLYEIRKGGSGETITSRVIPSNWEIRLLSLAMPITFTYNGTVKKPGVFSIRTEDATYYIYFPFGKGRSYILET